MRADFREQAPAGAARAIDEDTAGGARGLRGAAPVEEFLGRAAHGGQERQAQQAIEHINRPRVCVPERDPDEPGRSERCRGGGGGQARQILKTHVAPGQIAQREGAEDDPLHRQRQRERAPQHVAIAGVGREIEAQQEGRGERRGH